MICIDGLVSINGNGICAKRLSWHHKNCVCIKNGFFMMKMHRRECSQRMLTVNVNHQWSE